MKIAADTNVLVRAMIGIVSFDKKAVKLMEARGESTRLLS